MAKFSAQLVGSGKLLIEMEVEPTDARPTMRVLLQQISKEYANLISIDPQTREVDPEEYQIMVNERDWQLLPQRLETELSESDRVSITAWLEPLFGG